jgi:hypothetical protein
LNVCEIRNGEKERRFRALLFVFRRKNQEKMARNAAKTEKNKVFEQNLAKILAYMQNLL